MRRLRLHFSAGSQVGTSVSAGSQVGTSVSAGSQVGTSVSAGSQVDFPNNFYFGTVFELDLVQCLN